MAAKNIEDILTDIPAAMLTRSNAWLRPTLHGIWSHRGISRKELADQVGISKVAVSRNVDLLIQYQAVAETAAASGRCGRQPIALSLTPALFFAAGIRIGHEYSQIVITDAVGKIVFRNRLDHTVAATEARVSQLIAALDNALAELSGAKEKLAGIGIVFSGQLDHTNRLIAQSASFADAPNFPLADRFEKHFHRTTVLINNANLMALNEHWHGRAAGEKSFLYLTSGYGLGMFLNGAIYTGVNNNAGEVGMMLANGSDATVNQVKPFYRIIPQVMAAIASGESTLARNYVAPDGVVTLETVLRAIEHGDELCSRLMRETFTVIAQAVVNVACLFNPGVIFLEPWTARCPHLTLEVIASALEKHAPPGWWTSERLKAAALGYDELAPAVASLVVDRLLH